MNTASKTRKNNRGVLSPFVAGDDHGGIAAGKTFSIADAAKVIGIAPITLYNLVADRHVKAVFVPNQPPYNTKRGRMEITAKEMQRIREIANLVQDNFPNPLVLDFTNALRNGVMKNGRPIKHQKVVNMAVTKARPHKLDIATTREFQQTFAARAKAAGLTQSEYLEKLIADDAAPKNVTTLPVVAPDPTADVEWFKSWTSNLAPGIAALVATSENHRDAATKVVQYIKAEASIKG